MPDPTNLPSGCKFHPRCPHATEYCKENHPEDTEIAPRTQGKMSYIYWTSKTKGEI